MKKLLLLFIILGCTLNLYAQVSKSVSLAVAGTLSSTLTFDEQNTVTKLNLAGTIDARDFRTMRDLMPMLADIDLSGATIVAYEGADGTYTPNFATYPEHEIPQFAFVDKTTLTNVKLPISASSIGKWAFYNCKFSTIQLPQGLANIDENAFNNWTRRIKYPVCAGTN